MNNSVMAAVYSGNYHGNHFPALAGEIFAALHR
jgi:hypothetical protein